VELHAGHALEICRHEEQREEPVLVSEVRSFNERPDLDGEELAAAHQLALAATVGHGRMLRAGLDIGTAAARAMDAIRPAMRDEPCLGGRVVGEQAEESLEV